MSYKVSSGLRDTGPEHGLHKSSLQGGRCTLSPCSPLLWGSLCSGEPGCLLRSIRQWEKSLNFNLVRDKQISSLIPFKLKELCVVFMDLFFFNASRIPRSDAMAVQVLMS